MEINMKKKIISLILAITMIFGVSTSLSSCGGSSKPDALVIMTDILDGLFNPFYSTTASDATIVSMTQIGMLTTGTNDKDEVQVAYGDSEAVVTKDYMSQYNSQKDETTYTFVLKNGIKFSDGEALTIEDVLFNMYVYLDPVYTGSSTMYSTKIKGLADYRTQTFGADDSTDEDITATARDRAADRINELVNLFYAVVEDSSTKEAGYDAMVGAIKAHAPSSGYKSAISNDPSKVTFQNLLDDYNDTLARFKKELAKDYDSAQEAYTEKPYSEHDEFKNPYVCFLYYEGFANVTVEFKKLDGGKEDKSVIEEITVNYPDYIDTKEEAVDYVYDSIISTKLDQVLMYWGTAQELSTEYTAKAKEVILHESASDGLDVPNIEGIVSLGHSSDLTEITVKSEEYGTTNTYKIAKEHNADGSPKNADEYDVLQITIEGIDPKAMWNFAFSVAPQHYYAKGYTVDISKNNFGVDYASYEYMTDVIQSDVNVSVPMGAGAYKATNANNDDNPKGSEFSSNNVVYFKANESFLLGAPKIDKVRYQVVSSTNAIDALEAGSVHFVTPQLTLNNENRLNSLESKGFASTDARQLGYGYIGINAGKIPNIYLRKAIMAAMNISLATEYYSLGSSEPIYWPMSKVSWAYPKNDANQFDDVNGFDYPAIRYSEESAKTAVEEYMRQAASHGNGYSDKDLEVTFTIAGSNLTDHPTYKVFDSAAQLLNSLGWDVEVIADSQALTKLSTGSLAVWAAAWGTTVDPDMYQVYHKNSTATSVYAWGYREILSNESYYWYENDLLDEMSEYIDEARETDVRADRADLYREAMSCVLDLAVELPVYQRDTLYAYNANVIKASSLPQNINPYTSPLDRIWEIEFAE